MSVISQRQASTISNQVHNAVDSTTIWRTAIGNYTVIYMKGNVIWRNSAYDIEFPRYATPKDDGLPLRILSFDNNGKLMVSSVNSLDGRYISTVTSAMVLAALGYTPISVETDPTVPSYAKSLTSFSVIKGSTDALYQAIGSYITTEIDPTVASHIKSITTGNITTWNTVNGKLNVSDTTGKWKPIGYVPTWTSITGKPAFFTGDYNDLTNKPTIPTNTNQLINGAGFITSAALSGYATTASVTSALAGKQDVLVSGTNLKTVGGQTLLGSGNVSVGSGTVTSVALSSTDFLVSGTPITASGTLVANLANSGVTAGTYGRVTVNAKGIVTAGKRQETFSGTTNASGIYTVTFGSSYSVAPNIQANIVNGTNNQVITMTASTTGFTCTVSQRNAVTLLGIEVLLATAAPVNNSTVDVLITEK